MDDTNIQLLCSADIVLPSEVAVAVLAGCEPSMLPTRPDNIASSLRFLGPSAIACARSHPVRAGIIAARTADVDVQRALFELSTEEEFESILEHLAQSELVSDQALLRDIHDRIYRGVQRYAPKAIIDRVDVVYMLDWLDQNPEAYGSNLPYLAKRVAEHSASTRDATTARRFVGICDRSMPSSLNEHLPDRYLSVALGRLATVLANLAASDLLAEVVAGFSAKTSYIIALTAWNSADVIDANIADLAFSQVNAEAFYEQQRFERERRSREIPQYPSAFERSYLRCTDDAWRLIAATWPGLLHEPLRNLVNSDPQRKLLVELALKSGRGDLAHTLIDRKYHQEGERSGPLLDAAQYAVASSNLGNVEHRDGRNSQSAHIGGQLTVSYIPSGTKMKDVLRIWSEHALADIVSTLCDAKHAMWHEWRPTREEFDDLIDRVDRRALRQAVRGGLHGYGLDEHRPSIEEFALARPYLDAAAARVAVVDLLDEHGGSTYVATRLNEAFEVDVDGWLCAWNLSRNSTMSLDAVVSAARRLT